MIIKVLRTPYNSFLVLLFMFGCTSGEYAEESNAGGAEENMVKVKVHHDSLFLNSNKGLVYHNQKVFSGISESYYDNGQLKSQTAFLNGKKHGTHTKWFNNGVKSFESIYQEGKQNGRTSSWWSNGNLRSIANFQHGVAHGIQEQWYVGGSKFKRMQLNNGREEGLQQSWRENGKLYNNYEARNGRIFGLKRAQLCYELKDEKVQVSFK